MDEPLKNFPHFKQALAELGHTVRSNREQPAPQKSRLILT